MVVGVDVQQTTSAATVTELDQQEKLEDDSGLLLLPAQSLSWLTPEEQEESSRPCGPSRAYGLLTAPP